MSKAENRKNVALSVLAATPGGRLTPVQIQKALFLIDKRIPESVDGPLFKFRPYHYGPFDSSIYVALEDLQREGAIQIDYEPSFRRNTYRLEEAGHLRGKAYLESISPDAAAFISKVANFVSRVSFSELVSSIYRAYPEMKAKSVFSQ
jgi:uncharacterized protein